MPGPGRVRPGAAVIRNFLKLSFGNALAQGLQWLALLGCIHFYSAAAYGTFYAGIAAIGMIGILSSLQMHQIIVVARDGDEVEGVFRVGVLSHLLVMLLSVLGAALLRWTGHLRLDPLFLGALGWILFMAGVGRIYQGWFVKTGAFGLISKGILIRAVVLSVAQLALGWLGVAQGLVLGTLAGEVAALAFMATRAESPALRSLLRWAGGASLARLLKAYDDFVVGGTLAEFVSTVAFSLPVVLFGWRYTATAAGHFSLSHRLIWAPIAMVGLALSQVLYKRLAEGNPQTLNRHRAFRILWGSIGVAIVATFLIGWTLPGALRPLMKASWAEAYAYMPPLVAWGLFFLVSTPYRVSYRILRMQKTQLSIDAIFLTWVGFLFLVVAKRVDSIFFCYVIGISGVMHQILLMTPVILRMKAMRHSQISGGMC